MKRRTSLFISVSLLTTIFSTQLSFARVLSVNRWVESGVQVSQSRLGDRGDLERIFQRVRTLQGPFYVGSQSHTFSNGDLNHSASGSLQVSSKMAQSGVDNWQLTSNGYATASSTNPDSWFTRWWSSFALTQIVHTVYFSVEYESFMHVKYKFTPTKTGTNDISEDSKIQFYVHKDGAGIDPVIGPVSTEGETGADSDVSYPLEPGYYTFTFRSKAFEVCGRSDSRSDAGVNLKHDLFVKVSLQ